MAELLQEKRYEDITVRDILDRANIGSSTFYAHYFDKEDVQASLIQQLFEQLLQQLLRRSGKREVVPSLELFQHVQQNFQQIQALMPGRFGETFWGVAESTMSQMIEQSLKSTRGLKHSGSVPLPVVARYLAATFLTLLKWWLIADMPYSPEQMDEFFQQLALPGRYATGENKSE
jgi:AcrR family transcriptional regulator